MSVSKLHTAFDKIVREFTTELSKELWSNVNESDFTEDVKSKIKDVLDKIVTDKLSDLTVNNTTSSKKKKQVNKVKRPPTAYNLFIAEKIKELKETNPDIDRKELMKMAAQEWNLHKTKIKK